jgi:Phosphotransferase enzyme family
MLFGGVGNAGSVFRRGNAVLRPSSVHSRTIHDFLRAIRSTGFTGVPEPVSIGGDHEEFAYIEGDVAIPPYPSWAQTDSSLVSIAALLRRFHDASNLVSASFLPNSRNSNSWNDAFGPWPTPGQTICHFDVCLENVVFRNGVAVAFLDFDFGAPGDPLDDLASFARMCVPIDDDTRLHQLGWEAIDVARRIRLATDAYGLGLSEHAGFVDRLDDSIRRAEVFVRTRVARGEPSFVAMWESFGGDERFRRRREWFAQHRQRIDDALLAE